MLVLMIITFINDNNFINNFNFYLLMIILLMIITFTFLLEWLLMLILAEQCFVFFILWMKHKILVFANLKNMKRLWKNRWNEENWKN